MLRQTINLIEQQKSMACMINMPKIIISNTSAPTIATASQSASKIIPKFDWNPVKYNFNFELLQSEYAIYCKQYNVVNKFDKKSNKQANNEESSIDQAIQNSYLQTAIFNPTYNFNCFPISSESNNIVYDMKNKRSKQAKKKRSKRKNGGHQSIRC